MYKITNYSRNHAAILNVVIKPSTRKNKKIDVYEKDGTFICAIGDSSYSDYPTYIKTHGRAYADKRRYLYRIRHARYRNIVGTPSYFANHLLW